MWPMTIIDVIIRITQLFELKINVVVYNKKKGEYIATQLVTKV